jgi:hypothetical protein
MSDRRCDAALSNGKRCKNDASHWIHAPDPFDESDWPIAVCELHAVAGAMTRLGPDRRREYQAAVGKQTYMRFNERWSAQHET